MCSNAILKPTQLELVLCNKRIHTVQAESAPLSETRERERVTGRKARGPQAAGENKLQVADGPRICILHRLLIQLAAVSSP